MPSCTKQQNTESWHSTFWLLQSEKKTHQHIWQIIIYVPIIVFCFCWHSDHLILMLIQCHCLENVKYPRNPDLTGIQYSKCNITMLIQAITALISDVIVLIWFEVSMDFLFFLSFGPLIICKVIRNYAGISSNQEKCSDKPHHRAWPKKLC